MVVGLGFAADAHSHGHEAYGIDAYVADVKVVGNGHFVDVGLVGLDVGEFLGDNADSVIGLQGYGYIGNLGSAGVEAYPHALRMAEDVRLGKDRNASAARALDDVVHVGAILVGCQGYGSHTDIGGLPIGHAH